MQCRDELKLLYIRTYVYKALLRLWFVCIQQEHISTLLKSMKYASTRLLPQQRISHQSPKHPRTAMASVTANTGIGRFQARKSNASQTKGKASTLMASTLMALSAEQCSCMSWIL